MGDKGSLILVGMTGSWCARGQVVALNCQRQAGHIYNTMKGSRDWTGNQNAFAHWNIWQWLINHGLPWDKIDRQPDKALLDLYNKKTVQV